jgi:SWI/SNF-related matrix-associated actin-dependent regulator 1 of chromatin subfamily A
MNRPQELVSQLKILGRLEEFGGWHKFVTRFCNAYRDSYGWNISGAAHLEELNDKLREVCFIRRTKAEVLKELPAKQRSEIMVELSNREDYARAEADVVSWIRERVKADAEFHRQIDDLPEEIQETIIANRADAKAASAAQAETLVRIEALKQLSAEGKMEAVVEWIEDFIDSGEKLVVFATHKSIVKRLAEKFEADSITGDTPVEKRQAAVDRFQNDPAAKVIVCNIQAGGVGITLTAASNVAFVELGWNPAAHDQAEDRTHRIGQTDSVTAYYFIGEDSIDEWIYDLIEEKRVVVDATTDGVVREKKTSGMLKDLVKRLTKKGEEPGISGAQSAGRGRF